ncbi:MAG TPA: hypothetical protein VGD81_00440 [Opitutaceae bacterium]
MFKRLILEEYTAVCLGVAFATAATIFFAFVWRALRMSRTQADRFAHLPFASDGADASVDQPAAPDDPARRP